MVYLKKNASKKILSWNNREHLDALKKRLSENKVAITSTDTVYGFLATLNNEAFENLNVLKGGRQDKPYLILIGSPFIKKLPLFIESSLLTPKLGRFLEAVWPGPVTLIFKAHPDNAHPLVSPQGTVALRCPDHHGLQSLLQNFDGLFSTSANASGEQPPATLDEINPLIAHKVSLLMTDPGKEEKKISPQPSSIIDLSDIYCPKIIRLGRFPVETLEELYGTPFLR